MAGIGRSGNTSSLYQKNISLLFLASKWQFDTYGLSTVNKSLVNNLRLVDPDGTSIQITCAVLEEDRKIGDDQLRDAEKHGVTLTGAKQPRGKRKKPELSWLNEQAALYYRDIVHDQRYDFIIGHIPYLADGSLNLRDLSKDFHKGHSSKVILVAHALPLTDEGDVDEECLTEWLKESDLVLSVGENVWAKLDSYIQSMDNADAVVHRLYLPGFPLDFFKIEQRKNMDDLKGEQSIILMTSEIQNLNVSGLDFDLAVVSSTQASEYVMFHDGSNLSRQISFNLKLITTKEDEKILWERNFMEIKEKDKKDGKALVLKFHVPKSIDKLIPHLKRATVLLLPLKPESPLFGVEALVAMAAGVPVLVSRNSGIASFLHRTALTEPVVWDNEGFIKDAKTWKERLIQKIVNPQESQHMAKELRKFLILDTQIASTHLEFIQNVAGKLDILVWLVLNPYGSIVEVYCPNTSFD